VTPDVQAVHGGARVPTGPDSGAQAVLRSRAEAEAYVASVCFKHGPPRLVGAELEWLLHPAGDPHAPVDLATLVAALGPHTPSCLDPRSPATTLPAGSAVTVEPGGQVEIASPPLPDVGALSATLDSDSRALHERLAGHGLVALPRAADGVRPPHRLLDLPRYRAMEHAFDRIGPYGRSGMCATAAVQVCLDPGEEDALVHRWTALHALGPVLMAAFANSPRLHGRRTGWKSSRMAAWLALDPVRTAPPRIVDLADPATGWARRVLDTPLLCLRRPEGSWSAPAGVTFADWIAGALTPAPTTDDLDYHVTTMFPPVRPHGHVEVRYLDMQPGRRWAVPVAVVAALVAEPVVTDRVLEVCEPTAGRWESGARHGLADRVLARAATRLFDLACSRMPAVGASPWVVDLLGEHIERYVLRGRCPADDPDPAGGPARRSPVPSAESEGRTA
jgi:glutamate--cysteine ligase